MSSPEATRVAPKSGKLAAGLYEVEALRWFGRGRVLCEESTTGLTAPVRMLLPGERAVVEVGESGLLRDARLIDLLKSSAARATQTCTQAAICPGCSMQHVQRSERARYAQTLCSEVLARFGGWEIAQDEVRVVMGDEGGHRIRTGLRLRWSPGEGEVTTAVGMAQWPDASLPLADFSRCEANHPALRAAADRLRFLEPELWASMAGALSGTGTLAPGAELSLALTFVEGRLLVDAEDAVVAQVVSAVLGASREAFLAPWGVEGVEVGDPDRAWTHANPSMQDRLYAEALSMVEVRGERVWDLTCGEGGFALALARAGAEVLASDRHWDAVQRCEANWARAASQEAISGSVVTRGGDALAVLRGAARREERAKIAVINPMREPLGEAVMEALDASCAKKLLYLAPAPKAGARDFSFLRSNGWVISSVAAVDLHPWTGQPMMVFCALRVDTD